VALASQQAAAQAQGNWSLVNGTAWPPRSDHSFTVFQGQVWVIGGEQYIDSWTVLRDVWSSPDGVSWTQAPTPAFPGVAYHAVEVLNDTLVLTGGGVCIGAYTTVCFTYDWFNTTWTSKDGTTWLPLPPPQGGAAAGPGARGGHTLTPFGNVLILTGGLNNTADFNDVWSFDGAAWSQLTPAAAWAPRSFHQVVTYEPAGAAAPLLVLTGGGNMTGEVSEVWTSADGVEWVLLTSSPGWSARTAHATVAVGGLLFVFAGMHNDTVSQLALDDAWSSADGGATWSQMGTPQWGKRSFLVATVWQDTVWVSGGWWLNYTGLPGPGPDPQVPFDYIYYSDVYRLDSLPDGANGAAAR
jgi:hypothetical protein